MSSLPRSLSAAIVVSLLGAGCSSSPAHPPSDVPAADAAGTDAPPTPSDAGTSSDAPAMACHDFTGGYALTGTCSVPGFSVFPSACIAQSGCEATVTVTPGALRGTVRGNALTFGTMVAGIPLECTATPAAAGALTVMCSAAGGAATCEATAAPLDFPGATRACCDVGGTACGASQRCTIIGQGTPASLLTACVPASGALALGAACERAGGRPGADECGAGLFCANTGQAGPTTRVCQRLCRHTGDCATAEACVALADATRAGVCRPTCTLGGSTCAAGSCRFGSTFGATDPANAQAVFASVCSANGSVAEGATCTVDGECVADHLCVRRDAAEGFRCRRACDPSHACPGGQRCVAATWAANPNGVGFCVAE